MYKKLKKKIFLFPLNCVASELKRTNSHRFPFISISILLDFARSILDFVFFFIRFMLLFRSLANETKNTQNPMKKPKMQSSMMVRT